jgi:hypothetical protein
VAIQTFNNDPGKVHPGHGAQHSDDKQAKSHSHEATLTCFDDSFMLSNRRSQLIIATLRAVFFRNRRPGEGRDPVGDPHT